MIAAVDIGGTKIAVGMVDDGGNVLSKMESPTEGSHVYSNGLERIADMLRETAHTAGTKISGIGIGSTGPVNPFVGTFGDVDFIPQWRGKNLVKDLARIFDTRVVLENDADAGALAEAGWGAGRNKSRLVYVTVGTGIGGGIILDGQLYRGVDGAHPEVTRLSIRQDRFALAVFEAAGRHWLLVPPWSRGSRAITQRTLALVKISLPNVSASLRSRETNWLCGRSNGRPTTWGSVWPIW